VEVGLSQGRDLALTGLFAQTWLDSGARILLKKGVKLKPLWQ
jgi:hypothetical protein